MAKSADAFRTISEVAEWLDTPAHVLRFWESKFTQVKPVKRAGGRRYYRRQDMELLAGIKKLLHDDGMTIKAVQRLLREEGVKHVAALGGAMEAEAESDIPASDTPADARAQAVQDTAPPAKPAEAPVQAATPEMPRSEPPAPTTLELEQARGAGGDTGDQTQTTEAPRPEPNDTIRGGGLFSTPPMPTEAAPEAPEPEPESESGPEPAPTPQVAGDAAPVADTEPPAEPKTPWPVDDGAASAPDGRDETWPHPDAPLKTAATLTTEPAPKDAPAPQDASAATPDTDTPWPADDGATSAPDQTEGTWPHPDAPLKTAATMPESTPSEPGAAQTPPHTPPPEPAAPKPIMVEVGDDPADTWPAPRGPLSRVQDLPRSLSADQAARLRPLRDRLRTLLDNRG